MSHSKSSQAGITLIEMMVAITVGLILLAGIVQLFVSNKQAYRIQEGANLLNENSRFALNQLEYSIRMAGHFGGARPGSVAIATAAPADDCTEIPALTNDDPDLDMGYAVEGLDGADESPLDCIPDADYRPNTDIVVLRYAAPERIPDADVIALEDTQFLRARAAGGADIFDGADFSRYEAGGVGPPDIHVLDATDGNFDLVANYLMKVEIYFIRNCASQTRGDETECDAADDAIPTLARLTLRDGALVQEDVVSGVEQLQVMYGVDDNGDRSPNRYVNATDVEAGIGKGPDWSRVVDTRVSLVLRNAERDVTFKDERTYRLYGGDGGAGVSYEAAPADQSFRRKVYNSSIQSRNTTRNLR